jgi:hypothetical protein
MKTRSYYKPHIGDKISFQFFNNQSQRFYGDILTGTLVEKPEQFVGSERDGFFVSLPFGEYTQITFALWRKEILGKVE